jgi:galactokinase
VHTFVTGVVPVGVGMTSSHNSALSLVAAVMLRCTVTEDNKLDQEREEEQERTITTITTAVEIMAVTMDGMASVLPHTKRISRRTINIIPLHVNTRTMIIIRTAMMKYHVYLCQLQGYQGITRPGFWMITTTRTVSRGEQIVTS